MRKITFLLTMLISLLSLQVNSQTYVQENFDTAIPATWTITDAGDATGDSWISGQQGGINNLDGSNAAVVDSDANGNGVLLLETLETPVFDSSAATNVFLDFDQFYNNGGGDRAIVEVFDGTAWVEILNQSANAGAFGTPDQQHINISAYANANMQVRFIYDDMNVWAWYWLIDNVAIYNETCAAPTALTFDSATDTTANLSWTAGGSETAWEIVVQTAGTGIPTGVGTATGSNAPYVAMALTPATNYEAYVRADCGGGDLSIWVGPLNFATECTTFAAPYTEGFENGGAIPLCWAMDGGEDWNFDDVAPAFGHIGDNGTITGNTATNGFFAWVDASGNDGPSTLTTPFVDVSTLTTPSITFYEISNNEGNANSTLEVEVWDGAAWNLMGTYNTNTSGWEQKTINISTLTITGDVQARFIFSETVTGDFYDDIAIDDVTFDELPSCVNPSNLAVDSTTSTTATLSWVSNGTEAAWEVVVQAPGTGVPTGAGTAAPSNPYVAMGLTPATTYEYYIRADCGGGEYSDWIGPVIFDTECTTFVAPYTEGFENAGVIPLCWTMDGGEDWNFDDVAPAFGHIGDNGTITGNTATNGFFAWVDASGNDGPSTLTTPFVDVSTLTTPSITFYEISNNEGNANSTLEVEVWDGAAWNLMATYNTNTSGWEQRTINISTLTITGDVQARFIFSETVTGDFYDDIAIDDVTFDELPSCVNPSNLAVDSTTSTTATLSWVSNGTETAWEVVVQAPGTGVPTGAGTAAPSNPYVAMGLTPATTYEYYIRADCGGGEYSDWIGPVIFDTECTTFVAPYTEGFENAGVIPLCWTMDGGEDWNFDDVAPAFGHIGDNGTITGTTDTNAYFAWVDASGNDGPSTLTTPFVDVSTLAQPTLSFFEISDNEDNANSQLDVEVWDGAAWNPMGTYNTNTNGWEEKFIDLSSLTITGDVQARFIFSEPTPNDFYDDIAIDDVTFDEAPTCFDPEATYTIVDDCANGDQFLIDVDVIYFGGATSVTIQDNQGSPSVSVTASGATQFGPYPLNTDVSFTISSDQDTCSTTSPIINLPTCPPANDNCINAIDAPVNNDGSCTLSTPGTLFGATASTETSACTGTANDDVWFSFVATSTDHAIALNNIVGPTTFLSHGVYEGADCNSLTNLYCSTDDESVANGLTIGNTYYIRIHTFDDMDFQDVNFDLCIFTIPPPITASISQFTVPELVEDVLINSPCSSISNVTWSTGTDFGSDNGIGYFESNGSSFPFANGIVMTTGNAENAPGPETGTLSDGGGAGWPGDADLEAEIMEGTTNNASIIEFDFQPFISEMSFEFIFAAEEYGTFQCGFSDAFAFLLTDTVTNVTTNIAVIPGTTTPVSVFTIRDMAFNGGCPSANPELFDAFYGPGGQPALTSPTNFLGRTVPLTAMSTVVPNRTYHIKLVIADDGDTAFDSAVFLKGGSFVIGEPDLGEDITLGSGNANCEGDEVILDIGVPVPDTATITWYTINNGIQEPILDENGMPENGPTLSVTQTNTYQVEIVLNTNAACFVIDQVLVEFFENPIANPVPDILGCDDDEDGLSEYDLTTNEVIIIGTQTDVIVTFYESEQDALDGVDPIADPSNYISAATTIYYRVENIITGCSKTNSFNLTFGISPETSFTTDFDYEVCPNATVPIIVTATPDNYTTSEVTIAWYNEGVLVSGQTDLSIDNVLTAGTYTIEVTFNDTGCLSSEDIVITELQTCVIPQGISPNGDGLNDTFDLSSYDVQSLQVFNRNGTLVYEKTSYLDQWHGQSLDGDELPVGTYYYVMNYQGSKTKAAWVYINR